MCGGGNTMKVVTERIVKRWNDIPQLQLPEVLYSLTQALEGYSTLFAQAGCFEVTPNMMGITNAGNLKVWLNENFAINCPAKEKGVLMTRASTDKLEGVDS
jgi:hypothetical protein